jgi:hypothetical protein
MSTVLDPPSTGPEATRPDQALVRLWIGVLLAPASWVADFMIRYLSIRYANVHDRRWPMVTSTAVAVVLVLFGAGLCWRERQRAGRDASSGSAATLATWGLGLAAFFLLLILAQAFPTLVLRAREIS